MSSSVSDLRLRLTPEQRQAVERLAQQENVSTEEAIMRAVEQALAQSAPAAFPVGTPFHGLADLLNDPGDGPADLSTNRAYLDDLGA